MKTLSGASKLAKEIEKQRISRDKEDALEKVRNSAKKHLHRFLSPEVPNSSLRGKLSDLVSGARGSVQPDFTASLTRPTVGGHRRIASGFDASFDQTRLFVHDALLRQKSPAHLSYAQRAHEIDSIWNKSGRVTASNPSNIQAKLAGIISKPESFDYVAARTPIKHLGLGSPKYQSAWKSPSSQKYAGDLQRVLSPTSAQQARSGTGGVSGLLAQRRPQVSDLFSGFSKRRESGATGKPRY